MLIDSHCHLHDRAFEDTRGALTRATIGGGAVIVSDGHIEA